MNIDEIKTVAQLKEFVREEMRIKNPAILPSFERMWEAMNITRDNQVAPFIKGYTDMPL